MADINQFIDTLSEDIDDTFAPRIQKEVTKIGDRIAATAAPKVQVFANQLVKDIFAQESDAIRGFVIGLIKDLVGRYEPTVVGNLSTKIVRDGLELASDDIRLELKERATGKLIASLDLPVHFKVEIPEMFVELKETTIQLKDVQL